jgi:FkbM family methyltransferase
MPVPTLPIREPLELVRHLPRPAGALTESLPSAALFGKLRPHKVRNALGRRWFERQLDATRVREDVPVALLGTPYGGWIVPTGLIEPGWLCYTVGAGGDVSFDLELVRRFDARVRAFDAVEDFVAEALRDGEGEPRFSAHHAAIATADGPLRMQVSHDPRSRSVSSAGLYESSSYIELPGRTLPSLMSEFGDTHIDLLKLDVEGSEYELMPTVSLRELGVKVFAIQLHNVAGIARARTMIEAVRREGFEPVARRHPVKLTFVHSDLLG